MANTKYILLAFITLLLTAALVLAVAQRGVPSVVETNLENIPMEIAGYQGREDRFPQYVYDELQADKHVYRHYRSPEGEEISLYIGYYGTAKGGRTGHNPYACLPGAGWAIVEQGEVKVYPSYEPDGVALNYVVAEKEGVNEVMLHWYQSAGDKVLSSGLEQNIQRFVGRMFRNRNDGAFVRVSALNSEEPGVLPVKEKLGEFALTVLELLPSAWPVEG